MADGATGRDWGVDMSSVEEWFHPAPSKARLIDSVGTKRISVAGTSGAGKTYAVMRLCELLHERQSPFVVLDTVGNFWGLRVASDGKKPGLAIPVLGGMHGDLELDPAGGGLIAEFLHKTRTSLVIDLSMMDEEERSVFVTAFAKRVLGLWKQKRQVLTVIVDEAQDIVPEVLAVKGDKAMRGAMHTLGLQGRNFGIGLCLVTQAPQNVLKRLFNLADLFVTGRLGGEHERNAVVRWVKQKGLGKDALDELAELPTGTLYAWSPSWLEFFGKVRTTERWTLDSSKTPELGDVELEEGALAPVDLERLGQALRALSVAKAPAADGAGAVEESAELAELRERFEQLERVNAALLAEAKQLKESLGRVRESFLPAVQELWTRLPEQLRLLEGQAKDTLVPAPKRASEPTPEVVGIRDVDGDVVPKAFARQHRMERARRPISRLLSPSEGDVQAVVGEANGLDKPERTILGVLAWQKGPIPKSRVALLGGYSAKGGGFNNALGRLRKAGWMLGSSELAITAEGRKVAPAVSKPPTGAALLTWWLQHPRVDTPMAALLQTLHGAGKPLAVEELQAKAGYTPKTGGVSNALGRLRTLGLVVGARKEPVALAPELRR